VKKYNSSRENIVEEEEVPADLNAPGKHVV